MWILQLFLTVVGLAAGLEVGVPERFLRPRTFNHHPYTDVVSPATLTAHDLNLQQFPQILTTALEGPPLIRNDLPQLPEHPYALFRRPPTRDDDGRAPIQFPKVPEGANIPQQPRQRLKPENIKHPLNYGGIPQQRLINPQGLKADKKYAFSYSVLDRSSGDDFSHSQAGSGAQTKGEYRVKLPDGRVQVVSYTADHRGYRADVRYDEENFIEPSGYGPYGQSYYGPQTTFKQVQPAYRPPQPAQPPAAAPIKPAYKTILYDYEDTTLKPIRDFTPIHEDYGDYQDNTVSSTPSYGSEVVRAGYISQVPARAFEDAKSPAPRAGPIKFPGVNPPEGQQTNRFVGSTPRPSYLEGSPSPVRFSTPQDTYYFTTPSPVKLFVAADGQLYQSKK